LVRPVFRRTLHDMNTAPEIRLRALFAETFGEEAAVCATLRGDGSERRLYRLRGPSLTSIGVYGANVAENRAFIGFTRGFRASGLPVPDIHAVSPDGLFYLEEDLGDVLLFDWQLDRRDGADLTPEVRRMYALVLPDLALFQLDAAESIDYGLCYQHAEFGEAALRFDFRYFREMFLDRLRPRYDAAAFERDCDTLLRELLKADRRFFLYRDFQSRNVMIKDGSPRYIDYQSGRRGALAYDAASLLFDAKAMITPADRLLLFTGYLSEVSLRIPVDEDRFVGEFYAYAVARVMQALGAFGNLGFAKNKPGFRSSIPPALENLEWLARNAPVMKRLNYLSSFFIETAQSLRDNDFTEPS